MYAGCLAGVPPHELLIEEAESWAHKLCGRAPVIIAPELRQIDPHPWYKTERYLIPKYAIAVNLTSLTPVSASEATGSEFSILTFMNKFVWNEDVLDEILKKVDWKAHAKDWFF